MRLAQKRGRRQYAVIILLARLCVAADRRINGIVARADAPRAKRNLSLPSRRRSVHLHRQGHEDRARGHGIADADFNAPVDDLQLEDHLQKSLDKFKVPDRDRARFPASGSKIVPNQRVTAMKLLEIPAFSPT